MFFLTVIATITGASVASGAAVGSLAGAGVGLAAAIHEAKEKIEYRFL